MSYDLRVSVKVEGCDKYADIGYPEYDHPTYNLRDMFEACMNWDYSQGEYYPCAEYVSKIERGITELKFHRENYVKYNPSNGWGSIDSALKALESWWECIQEQAETIPIDRLMPNRKVKGPCWYRSDSEWGDVVYDDTDIIAWMPLPKPYREDGEA